MCYEKLSFFAGAIMPSSWKILICRKENGLIIRCMIIENYSWVFLLFFITSLQRGNAIKMLGNLSKAVEDREASPLNSHSSRRCPLNCYKCIGGMSLFVKVNEYKFERFLWITSFNRISDFNLTTFVCLRKIIKWMLNKTSNFIKNQ